MTGLNYISQGTGIPLVFQHGLTANVQQVQALLGDLQGFHLLSIDCPGHGLSLISENYFPSFDKYSEEVIKLLDNQGIEKAIFGGISMGAGISINIAIRYLERVQALILIRPAWLAQSDPENLRILLPAAKLMNVPGGKQLFEELPEFQRIKPVAAAESIGGIFSENQQAGLERVINRLVGDRPFSSMSQLEDINMPCLVIGNDDDPLHPFDMAEKIYQAIPGSTLRKVTSRYIDNDLHSKEVKEAINEFMNENNLR